MIKLMNFMERRYEDVLKHYEEIMHELNTDIAVKDNDRYMKLMKEQSDLAPLVSNIEKLKKAEETEKDSLNIIDTEKDEELLSMAREDLSKAKKDIEELEQTIKLMLIPKDPFDDRNIIIEIRQGAGGDEAALFAAEIYRMYQGYIASMGYKWSSESAAQSSGLSCGL